MSTTQTINFTDSKAAKNKPDFYLAVTLDIKSVLQSWKMSVFSYEWMDNTGAIKDIKDLKETDQEKRKVVESALQNDIPIEKPVLGIGIQDNVEIGSGKAVLCTLAAHGIQTIPAHIPQSNKEDFQEFIAEVS